MMYSLRKETKMCQVCKKSFPSGKALGGHMRSHTLKLSTRSATSSTTSSLTTFNKRGANFRPHETVLMRSVNTSRVIGGLKPDLNKEGEQQVTTKRTHVVDLDEVNSAESQDVLTDEEVALCFLQMNKDNWPQNVPNPKSIHFSVSTRKRKDIEKYIEIDSGEDHEDNHHVDEGEDNEDGDVKSSTSDVDNESDDDDDENAYFVEEEKKCKKKYICDICGKVLRSHQALGGHRTSHTNKRLKIADKSGEAAKPENGAMVQRRFECQICGRVFTSGQALGGHKKVHYAFLRPIN